MNNKELENLIRGVKLSLTKEEKKSLRQDLLLKLNGTEHKHQLSGVKKSYFTENIFNIVFSRYAVSAFVAVFFLAGTSYASQGSLPGDLLYPVKINLNEKVSGAFAFSPEAKAQREILLLERRLDETQKLISEGRFSAERYEIVETQLGKQLSRVKNRITELKSEENLSRALTLQSDLENYLEIYGRVFVDIGTRSSESEAVTSRVISELGAVSQDRSKTREVMEARSSDNGVSSSVVRERYEIARQMLAEIERGNQIREGRFSGSPFYAGAELLLEAKRKIDEGEALMSVNLYSESLELLNEAIRILREVKLLQRSQIKEQEMLDTEIGSQTNSTESLNTENLPDTGLIQGEFRSRDSSFIDKEISGERRPYTRPRF